MEKKQISQASKITKTKKNGLLSQTLILKQTTKAAWKNKLQIVILLLLATFCTMIITGSWISYNRLKNEGSYMGLNDSKFNAVLPFQTDIGSNQIADQAFSLHLGRFFYSDGSTNKAYYYDNTRIGKEIVALKPSDLDIAYTRDKEKKIINGVSDLKFKGNAKFKFNFADPNVKASIYGQLNEKYNTSSNQVNKNRYFEAMENLYNNIFLKITAQNILNSIKIYFNDFVKRNQDKIGSLTEENLTEKILQEKINYRTPTKDTVDFSMPEALDVSKDDVYTFLTKPAHELNDDPRLDFDSKNLGMNGQWMRIYRRFDKSASLDIRKNLVDQYESPYNYNQIADNLRDVNGDYSYILISAIAALQDSDIKVVNQFVSTAGVDATDGKTITVKVVNLGSNLNYSNVNLKIFSGIKPIAKNQVVISPQYARSHGINPGDTIEINKGWKFIVSGIGGDAFNIYPTVNPLDPVPNTRTEFIAYVYSSVFNDNNWYDRDQKTDNSLIYFLPWNKSDAKVFNTELLDDLYQRGIFLNNGTIENNQDQYNKYLVDKYAKNSSLAALQQNDSQFLIVSNNAINEKNSQFLLYNLGTIVFNQMIHTFGIALIIVVSFLSLVVIIITFLIVKKAIMANQVSMGILKATGYTTKKIAFSYLAYPLLTFLIAIPIGWITGLVSQIYFTEIFNTVFVLPYNVFSFNLIPLLISIALIVGVVFVTSVLTAYFKLQKAPLMLIKKNSDIAVGHSKSVWTQKHFQHSFRFKFWLSLSKTSWKKLLTTTGVIGLATLSIMTTISLPASISKIRDNYFKTQKYQNYYQYVDPAPNNPLSKYGLTNWSNFSPKTDEKGNILQQYYPVGGNMPFPKDIVIKRPVNQSDPSKGDVDIAYFNLLEPIKFVGDQWANIITLPAYDATKDRDIINEYGRELKNSPVGSALDISQLTSNYIWLGGRAFANQMVRDLQKQDPSPDKSFSSSLIQFAVNFLPGLIGVKNPGIPPSAEAIVQILQQTLPGYIRQILDSYRHNQSKKINPYDFFSMGHNSVQLNPVYNKQINGPEEELITNVQLLSNNNSSLSKEPLNILGINPQTQMFTMSSDLQNKLVYDPNYDPKTSSIPLVINAAFAARYNLQVGDSFNALPQIHSLYYQTTDNKYKPIPKSNWYYGEQPPDSTKENTQNDIWSKTANKWTYNQNKKPLSDHPDYKTNFGYSYDGMYDQDGNQMNDTKSVNEIKDWNNLNNVWLRLPDDITNQARIGKLRSTGTNKDCNGEFSVVNISDNSTSDPKKVTWIKPYSLSVTNYYKQNPISDEVSILLSRPPEWYGGMVDLGLLKYQNNINNAVDNNEYKTWRQAVSQNEKAVPTSYHVIGIQKSYDSTKAFVDRKWANRILGYSIYNQKSNQAEDPLYVNGLYQWFSGKLSASDNIYDIIGHKSFKYAADDYSIYGATIQSKGTNEAIDLIKSQDLLSRKIQMLNKLTAISFSASLLFIIVTIICSILIVIMITDYFTEQFRRFMALMKSEGYKNKEINLFTLGIFIPWALLGFTVGYGVGYSIIYSLLKIIASITTLVFPFSFIWWVLPFTLVLIAIIFLSTFAINNSQLNKMNLVELLKSEE